MKFNLKLILPGLIATCFNTGFAQTSSYPASPTPPSNTSIPSGTVQQQNMQQQGALPAQAQSAQSISPPPANAQQGTNLCGPLPTCDITAQNIADFVKYFKMCDQLGGATIKWQATNYIIISIKPSQENFCSMQVDNIFPDKPSTTSCHFDSSQIAQMTTPENIALAESFEKASSRAEKESLMQNLNAAMKPIFDCIGPIPEVERKIQIPGVPPVPVPAP